MSAVPKQKLTAAEYLVLESCAEFRSQLGFPWPMCSLVSISLKPVNFEEVKRAIRSRD